MILAQCPVCQELFTSASDCLISALPCGHVFHKGCVDRWIKTSSTCPQCRVNVKRMNVIARLFFDVVPFPSFTSAHNAPELNSSSTQDSVKQSQLRDPTVQLYQARSEIARLECELRETECRLAQQSKLAKDRENEVATLTTLYTESDKLCEQERQRCRGLRTELLSMKQFLRDAEAMKAETVKLRAEMEDMQSIKKLIGASEDTARELLSRYTLKPESARNGSSDFACNLESLCRWTAILRSELTGAREKARNYRIELSRLRKLHASAAQRAARSEAAVAEKNQQIQALEEQLSLALSRPVQTDLTDPVQNTMHEQVSKASDISRSPDLFTTPSSSSKPKTPFVLRPNTLTTPDLITLSPTECPTVELQKQLRTPCENPFRATSISDALTTSPQTPAIRSSDSGRSARFPAPLRSHAVQRRPSVLFEMAIMRRHLVSTNERNVSAPRSKPSCVAPTASHRDANLPCSSRVEKPTTLGIGSKRLFRPNKAVKTACGGSKLSRLDQFLMKQ